MQKVEYPKAVYLADGTSATARDIAHHHVLASQGYMTADEFDARQASPPTPDSPPQPDVSGDESSLLAIQTDETPIEALSVKNAVDRVRATTDADALIRARQAEENRAGGARKRVLGALADQIAVATVPPQVAEQETGQ